jgi:ring-1,2-phenylacetyl-CoA epoxidase subunit PaaC
MDELDNKMLEKNIGVDNINLKVKWDIIINKILNQAKLSRPEDGYMMSGSKKGLHTEFLGKLLAQMQYLPRAYPNAKW